MAALAALLRNRTVVVPAAETETNIILDHQRVFFESLLKNRETIVLIIDGPTIQEAKESIMHGRAVRFTVTQTPVCILQSMINSCKRKKVFFGKHTHPKIFSNALDINVYFPAAVLSQVNEMTLWNLRTGSGKLSPNYTKSSFLVEFSQAYHPTNVGIKGSLRITKNKT